VAHSTVPAAKSAAARQGYNLRAAECRVAADIARRFAERRGGGRVKERSLGTLRHRLRGVSGAESEELAAEIFPREGYPLQILEREYGIGSRELAEDYYLDPELLEEGTLPVLKLRQRFLHVLDECERVERFADLCRRGQKEAAGEVMNASHRSCRDLFEISCPELDVLTEIEKRGGALGARMTGAGFGGCTVALAERGRTEELRRVIIKEYYQAYLGEQRESYGDLIFPISAARGAEIL
jgi:N-acetylgalactosamine kinase